MATELISHDEQDVDGDRDVCGNELSYVEWRFEESDNPVEDDQHNTGKQAPGSLKPLTV